MTEEAQTEALWQLRGVGYDGRWEEAPEGGTYV